MQSLEHAGDSVAMLANSVHALANSLVGLKGAVQVVAKLRLALHGVQPAAYHTHYAIY